MRLIVGCCLFVLFCQGSYASNSNESDSSLTVLLDFQDAHASVPLKPLQRELQGILSDAHIRVNVKLKSALPDYAEFKELVVFKLKGHCTLDGLPIAALSDERGPLAMTYSVDGEILPFGEVECDRLQRTVRANPHSMGLFRQSAFNTALARVIAHEIYHMLACSNVHTKSGVTKESLSALELSSGALSFPAEAKRRLLSKENGPDR
jgi:predicted nucleotidyltransferase